MSKRIRLEDDEIELIDKLLKEAVTGYNTNTSIYSVAKVTLERLTKKLGIDEATPTPPTGIENGKGE